jgi:hypothetical protein
MKVPNSPLIVHQQYNFKLYHVISQLAQNLFCRKYSTPFHIEVTWYQRIILESLFMLL